MNKKKVLSSILLLTTLVGCGGVNPSSSVSQSSNELKSENNISSSLNEENSFVNSQESQQSSSATSEVSKTENKVKIKSIDVVEEKNQKSVKRMSSNDESSEEISSDNVSSSEGEISSSEEVLVSSSENDTSSSEEKPTIDSINTETNWVLIYKSQTDITFTVTLDDPRHLGIDALIITCDDPDSQIKVGDTYKPIQMEADGTRMVDWGDDPYEQTYHIRTTSPDAVNSFKVLDVRITNHEKFQSEETDNRDLGNNELKIYKMDDDAIKLNVVENTFEYVKFNYVIKEGYEDLISNVVVEGMTPDDDGYYYVEEDEREITAKYEYAVNENIEVELEVNDVVGKMTYFTKDDINPNRYYLYNKEFFGVNYWGHICLSFSDEKYSEYNDYIFSNIPGSMLPGLIVFDKYYFITSIMIYSINEINTDNCHMLINNSPVDLKIYKALDNLYILLIDNLVDHQITITQDVYDNYFKNATFELSVFSQKYKIKYVYDDFYGVPILDKLERILEE